MTKRKMIVLRERILKFIISMISKLQFNLQNVTMKISKEDMHDFLVLVCILLC
jgi:hypothetical protein